MSARRILVVEDEAPIRRGVVAGLHALGFTITEAATAPEAEERALHGDHDLVLLDVRLPGGDGFGVLAAIRAAKPGLPVIMVTARGADEDRIAGLDGGADDYVVKPFNLQELRARIEAVLRRSAERPRPVRALRVAGRAIDLERQTVSDGDRLANLSGHECDLLAYLAANRGRPISRDELLDRVWGVGGGSGGSRTVDMGIARLREKLGDADIIQTVRGRGYCLSAEA